MLFEPFPTDEEKETLSQPELRRRFLRRLFQFGFRDGMWLEEFHIRADRFGLHKGTIDRILSDFARGKGQIWNVEHESINLYSPGIRKYERLRAAILVVSSMQNFQEAADVPSHSITNPDIGECMALLAEAGIDDPAEYLSQNGL